MCHIAELVIGGCVLIAMTTLGVVAILGVLGVLERISRELKGLWGAWEKGGPEPVQESEDGGHRSIGEGGGKQG